MNISQKELTGIISINTFIVENSSEQQKIVDMLEETSKQILSAYEEFISIRIHKSLDGTRVMSFIHWENKEPVEKMLHDPRAIKYMNDISNIAKLDRHLYELVFLEEKI